MHWGQAVVGCSVPVRKGGFEVSQDIPGEKGLSSIVGLSRKY